MSEELYKLADEVLQFLGPYIQPLSSEAIEARFCPDESGEKMGNLLVLDPEEYGELQNCLALLEHEELIDFEGRYHTMHGHWKLTIKGLKLLQIGTSFATYMKQKEKMEKTPLLSEFWKTLIGTAIITIISTVIPLRCQNQQNEKKWQSEKDVLLKEIDSLISLTPQKAKFPQSPTIPDTKPNNKKVKNNDD